MYGSRNVVMTSPRLCIVPLVDLANYLGDRSTRNDSDGSVRLDFDGSDVEPKGLDSPDGASDFGFGEFGCFARHTGDSIRNGKSPRAFSHATGSRALARRP